MVINERIFESFKKWFNNGECFSFGDRFSNATDLSALLGKTLIGVYGAEKDSDIILFVVASFQETSEFKIYPPYDEEWYVMYHEQDCCECVSVDDINGDIRRLIGKPITLAESRSDDELEPPKDDWDESYTWTFYALGTVKGYLDIRWYGTSNGYYSESVDFVQITNKYKEKFMKYMREREIMKYMRERGITEL